MQNVELSPASVTQRGGDGRNGQADVAATSRPRRRIKMFSVALAAFTAFVIMSVVPLWAGYISSPRGRLSPAEHPWFFPVLILHVGASTVGLCTSIMQVWPWLRRKYPRVHRYTGRVYVFAGIYPAGVTAIVLTIFWPFSAVTTFGQDLLAVLWLSVTTYGFILARRGRTVDHRRWMLRSFALTASVMLNEILEPPIEAILRLQLHTRLAGSEDVLAQMANATDNWMGLTLSIIAVEWWLERDLLRRSARRRLTIKATADA
ncbi:MAG TPA: DUF2306 domain-containing protein [Micromonosporaceae bacterium]